MVMRQSLITVLVGSLASVGHSAPVAEINVLAHPAGFGQRWVEDATTEIVILNDFDLCQNSNASNTSIGESFLFNSSGGEVALLYDPYENDNSRCSFSEMASSAGVLYPTIQSLLIQAEEGKYIRAMAKDSDTSDSKLKLAMLSFEDGELIKDLKKNHNRTAVNGGVFIRIDATSRAIFDYCDCRDEDKLSTTLLVLRLTSIVSILGSAYIVFSLIGTKQRRSRNPNSTFTRLLIAICVSDILSSSAFSFGSSLVPATPPGEFEEIFSQELWDSQYPGAIGTPVTCTAQGFFLHFGLCSSTFLTVFVGLQTLLMVRYNWNEQQIRRAEIFFFLVASLLPLVTGIWASAIDLMNPLSVGFCWIDVSPKVCESTDSYPLAKEYCDDVVRGEDYVMYALFFGVIWIPVALLVICGTMVSLFLFVRKKERRAARWGGASASESRQQKRVLAKAVQYISVYLLVWVPTLVTILTRLGSEGEQVFGVNSLIPSIFLPLQGFFNAMIYSGVVDKCVQRCFCFSANEGALSYFKSSLSVTRAPLAEDAYKDSEITASNPLSISSRTVPASATGQ